MTREDLWAVLAGLLFVLACVELAIAIATLVAALMAAGA